jgi:hypothetical protein
LRFSKSSQVAAPRPHHLQDRDDRIHDKDWGGRQDSGGHEQRRADRIRIFVMVSTSRRREVI